MFPAPPPIMNEGDRMRCDKVRTSRDASKQNGAEEGCIGNESRKS